ncbi:MAG: cyclopropane fatty acyl phospholipid synthase [Lewinellaceae bacterium]|nr:cyclopropane fatty acyl phospholipid synthase [Lewinellaceae bacterium]
MTMRPNKAKSIIENLLAKGGIQINGDNPWDIQVHNEKLFGRMLAEGSLGFGEAYMDGWWDVEQLDEFFYKLYKFNLRDEVGGTWKEALILLQSKVLNMQTRLRSKKVAREHYDLGNDLYMSFLDPYNQYTCGYFKDTEDLNVAQEQKLELICKKLQLSEKDRVLDIGCGWGGFAKYAAGRYGCQVTGITISDQQYQYAKEDCAGLPVTILKKDYRDLEGTFDKVLICGMIEHVGYKNYRQIMEIVYRCLEDDGLFLLHTIGSNTSEIYGDPWVLKYIFPNSMLPSVKQIATASEGLFVMEDWHNFGPYYVKTLKAWFHNFDASWEKLSASYDERFYRMWKYYLHCFMGPFRTRVIQLWQVVLSKGGVPGGYIAAR